MRRIGLILAIVVSVSGCGSDDGGGGTRLPIAVLSAFPAEQLPLVERATVVETRSIGGFTFRFGQLGGVPVVLGMTGIGLLNAAATTRALLEQVEVAGVVVSAVAGSPRYIGDVVVPETWSLANGDTYGVDARWFEMAQDLTGGTVALENCTLRPNAPSDPPICLPQQPVIVVGGVGRSSDTFGTTPFACIPNGGDVFGCDIVLPGAVAGLAVHRGTAGAAGGTPQEFDAVDMETAAIAREAAAAGLPFIAFRGVSDGEGDPLGLPGFPAQFFTYYRLAARNAAAATIAFLEIQ